MLSALSSQGSVFSLYDQMISALNENMAAMVRAVSGSAQQVDRLISSIPPPAEAAARSSSAHVVAKMAAQWGDILTACNMDFFQLDTLDVSSSLKNPKNPKNLAGLPTIPVVPPQASSFLNLAAAVSPESVRSSSYDTSSEESCVVSSGFFHSSCCDLPTSCSFQSDCSSCFCWFHVWADVAQYGWFWSPCVCSVP